MFSACSNEEGENLVFGVSTTTTQQTKARQAADPLDGTLDPNRTTTTLVSTLARDAGPILHVLGSIRPITGPAPDWQTIMPPLTNDNATIASLGCTPTNEGCTSADVAAWAMGGIDLVNVATSKAADERETLAEFIQDATTEGLNVVGYGLNLASAVNGVSVGTPGSPISVHAISVTASDDASAGPDTPGIAGPSAFDALLATIADRQSTGHGVVVIVDSGSLDDRAPSPSQIADIERLIDAGVDAIVGHGSDYLERFDHVGSSSVAYGLGNAVIDTTEPLRTDSAVLRLEFDSPGRACLLPSTASAVGPMLDHETVHTCR